MSATDLKIARRLSGTERQRLLAEHRLWEQVAERGAIRRSFRFSDFAEAFGFMSAVAITAEGMDHHPEWSNVHGRVEILLSTHDVEGLSQRDVALAQRIDALALLFGAGL